MKQESNHVIGPLLSSPIGESHLTSLMQEIFLIAQNSDDRQLQQYAAWAVSFLRSQLWSKENLNLDVGFKTEMDGSKSSQNFADDSAVMKLSSWLFHVNISEVSRLLEVIIWFALSWFVFVFVEIKNYYWPTPNSLRF